MRIASYEHHMNVVICFNKEKVEQQNSRSRNVIVVHNIKCQFA